MPYTFNPLSGKFDYYVDDHGALAGLTDDDHAQYILADGSRTYTATGAGFKDEDNMASNSAVATASQQSIKAYVDSLTGVSYRRHFLLMGA